MKKKGLVFSAFVLGALLLMGCTSATAGNGGSEAAGSEQPEAQDLAMVCALIGKDDADTADHFYTLRLLENILTLGINPAVGELQ